MDYSINLMEGFKASIKRLYNLSLDYSETINIYTDENYIMLENENYTIGYYFNNPTMITVETPNEYVYIITEEENENGKFVACYRNKFDGFDLKTTNSIKYNTFKGYFIKAVKDLFSK